MAAHDGLDAIYLRRGMRVRREMGSRTEPSHSVLTV